MPGNGALNNLLEIKVNGPSLADFSPEESILHYYKIELISLKSFNPIGLEPVDNSLYHCRNSITLGNNAIIPPHYSPHQEKFQQCSSSHGQSAHNECRRRTGTLAIGSSTQVVGPGKKHNYLTHQSWRRRRWAGSREDIVSWLQQLGQATAAAGHR